MEQQTIKLTDIYNKFAFEWLFASDLIRWQVPAHLLLGETSLYESGDHLANRLTVENYKKRMKEISEAATERRPYSVSYEMQVQRDKVATIHEEGRVFYNPQGDMVLCRGYIWSHNVRDQNLNEYFSNFEAISYLDKILKETDPDDLNAAFLYLSIDRLPLLALKHGVDVNDEVLDKIQEIYLKATRSYDYVGRTSSTSFGIVLQKCGHNEIVVVAKRLNEMLERTPILVGGKEMNFTAAIGGCVIQASSTTTTANILNHSERALLDAQHLKKISVPAGHLAKKMTAGKEKITKRRKEDNTGKPKKNSSQKK